MEPSFSSRVQDVFGSLQASPLLNPEAQAPTTFWTVSGPQARGHAKQRKVPIDLGISNSESEVEVEVDSDEEDSDEDDDGDEDEAGGDGRANRRKRPVSCEQFKLGVGGEKQDPEEEFESGKRMIGMDDTLDFEEEEDEFDRVAEGIDLGANWLHAKDTSPFQRDTGPLEEMRHSIVSKGRTAILSASKRDTAKRSRSSRSEDYTSTNGEDRNGVGLQEEARDLDARVSKIPRICSSMKSVLYGEASVNGERNSTKHVRFAVDEVAEQPTTAEDRGSGAVTSHVVPTAPVGTSDRYSTVPDYVKNPTKYTYYSLDWSEEDEDANNRAAFKDLQQSKAVTSYQPEAQHMVELPKSLTFIARTKPPNGEIRQQEPDSDTKMAENQHHSEVLEVNRPVVQVTAHLTEEQAPEVGGEVEPRLGKLESFQTSSEYPMDKASRRYRNRSKVTNENSAMQIDGLL